MNFQNQLRKNFLTFSIKLIFIVFILFVSTTLIINLVEKNIYKIESINYLDNTFRELNTKIFNQMGNHNSNLEYLESVKNETIDKKLVSTNNYAFSQSMNLRYYYNIYDYKLDPIYEELHFSTLRYNMYLNIIKDRIENDDPLKFIMYSDLDNNNSYLVYYSGLYEGDRLIGVDTFVIDINDLSYFLLPNAGNYIIANPFDTVIASNNYEILNAGGNFKYSKNYKLNGVRYKVTRVKKDYYTIYYLEQAFSLEKYYIFMLFILILIIFLVIYFSNNVIEKIAKKNSKSIESIISDANIISLGKLDHKINENLEGDFKNLAKNINEMLNKLNSEIELNKELSETNLIYEKKKLDSQFNPHFLYNSLETIRYSMLFDVKEAEKYILELNSIFRYSINNNINYSSLKDDLKYLKKYLDLYKFRFKEKLTYTIKISKEMDDILVPKLSIQPLVENSIKYGFENSTKVHIDISAEMINNLYYIRVHDTGISISDKIINEIMESYKKKKNLTNHIGVHNVLRRFMMLYPDSTLDVRRDNNGTIFEITFKEEIG
ncbi:MAG: histidine kinase [Sphaerochaetaceae bacterium]|nr:histidine kinase [Sphaerochaetaceae bacterium]